MENLSEVNEHLEKETVRVLLCVCVHACECVCISAGWEGRSGCRGLGECHWNLILLLSLNIIPSVLGYRVRCHLP